MQPIFPYIAVEPIEDQGSLIVIQEAPIVKIIGLPPLPKDEYATSECSVLADLCIGREILVEHVSEYTVKGEKRYYVRLKDVVSIV